MERVALSIADWGMGQEQYADMAGKAAGSAYMSVDTWAAVDGGNAAAEMGTAVGDTDVDQASAIREAAVFADTVDIEDMVAADAVALANHVPGLALSAEPDILRERACAEDRVLVAASAVEAGVSDVGKCEVEVVLDHNFRDLAMVVEVSG